MATSNSSNGYSTHILGTTKSIRESLKVVVYNKYSLVDSKKKSISVFNIRDIYEYVTKVDKQCVELQRNNSSEAFSYNGIDYSRILPEGFNIIIYVNRQNSPIGYTEFSKTQGIDRVIEVIINPQSESSENSIEININRNISSEKDNLPAKLGDQLYEYVSPKTVKTDKNIIKGVRYTTHLSGTNDNNIYLGSGAVLEDSLPVRLNLSNGGLIDPHGIGFRYCMIGRYGYDIVLYQWDYRTESEIQYCIYCVTSLTRVNRYTDPFVYTRSNKGYKEFSFESTRVLYGAGRYLVCENGKDQWLFDIETETWKKYKSSVFIDPWDERGFIYSHENGQAGIEYIPEVRNTFLDPNLQKGAEVLRKVGKWFFIPIGSLIAVSSPSILVYTTQEDIEKLLIINDQILMIKENNYYTIYSGTEKTYWTERARVQAEGGSLAMDDNGILRCIGGGKDAEYDKLYETGEIRVAKESDNLQDTVFNLYRHGTYPKTENNRIPNIIACFMGILFYMSNNRIYYL